MSYTSFKLGGVTPVDEPVNISWRAKNQLILRALTSGGRVERLGQMLDEITIDGVFDRADLDPIYDAKDQLDILTCEADVFNRRYGDSKIFVVVSNVDLIEEAAWATASAGCYPYRIGVLKVGDYANYKRATIFESEAITNDWNYAGTVVVPLPHNAASIQYVAARVNEVEDTDTEFNAGTHSQTAVSGTGTAAKLVLENGTIDSYTKLLLHCDGADASTTFTDSAPTPKTVTANGNAQIDTAQSKFGGASGLFDGTGDYLSTPDSADWYFGTGDFTIDFWVRFNALPADGTSHTVVTQMTSADNRWWVGIISEAGVKKWQIYQYVGSEQINIKWATTIALNTWYHIAFIRTGNTFRVFQDGAQVGSDGTDTDAIPDLAGPLYIGAWSDGTRAINGWLDELRVSKGIARWTSNFTPPTDEYRVYSTPGNWTSQALDLSGSYKELSWTMTKPTNTDIKLQFRAGDANPPSEAFEGPTGVGDYFTGAGGWAIPSKWAGKRYAQVKAFLSTTDTTVTPTMDSVAISYAGGLFTRTVDDGTGANINLQNVRLPSSSWIMYTIADDGDLRKGNVELTRSVLEWWSGTRKIRVKSRVDQSANPGRMIVEYWDGAAWQEMGTLSLRIGVSGSEMAPTLVTPNWTLGTGWAYGTLLKNADGVGTAAPATPLSITAGFTYKVVITLSACTVGSCSYTLGGVAGSSLAAATTYTDIITATTTGNLIFTPSATGSRFTISAVSVTLLTTEAADSYVPQWNPEVNYPEQADKEYEEIFITYPTMTAVNRVVALRISFLRGKPFFDARIHNLDSSDIAIWELRFYLTPTTLRYWTRSGSTIDANAGTYGEAVQDGLSDAANTNYVNLSSTLTLNDPVAGFLRTLKAYTHTTRDAGAYWDYLGIKRTTTLVGGAISAPVWVMAYKYDGKSENTPANLGTEAVVDLKISQDIMKV